MKDIIYDEMAYRNMFSVDGRRDLTTGEVLILVQDLERDGITDKYDLIIRVATSCFNAGYIRDYRAGRRRSGKNKNNHRMGE